MTESERYARIQLALTPYIGAEIYAQLLTHYGSAQAALSAPAEIIAAAGRSGKKAAARWHDTAPARTAADAALAWAQQAGCHLLLAGDSHYPAMLTEGLTPPPLLFARGRTELLHQPAVAIVGSRHATPQALRIARDFAAALSQAGITVVSGMASGIDTAAHQGALPHSGSTIAVWGTGIDRIYPPENQTLAYQIAEQGLILSEFPLGTRPLAGNFPRRNRLIAAQSCATLVIEAALQSGSLITARLAAEMGREVMAVPGSIDNPHSKGCHQLIKDGAKLVENLDDILNECPQLHPASGSLKHPSGQADAHLSAASSTQLSTASAKHTAPSQAVIIPPLLEQIGYDPVHPDTLAEQLRFPAADLYALLTEWELEGHIAATAGGRYQRIR